MITRFVYKLFGGALLMLSIVLGAFSGGVTSAAAATAPGTSYVPVATGACSWTTMTYTNARGNVVTRQVYTCNGVPFYRFNNLARRYLFWPYNNMYRRYYYGYPYSYPYGYSYNYSAPTYSAPAPSYSAPAASTVQPSFAGTNAAAGTTVNVFTTGNPAVLLCSAPVGQNGQWDCTSSLAFPVGSTVQAYAALQPVQAGTAPQNLCAEQNSNLYACVVNQ